MLHQTRLDVGGADPFRTPDRHQIQPNGPRFGDPIDRVFGICRKKNDSLDMFKGTPEDFKNWRGRVVDHCRRTNFKWRQTLEYVSQRPEQIRLQDLEGLDLEGYPAAQLSRLFFNWICDFLPQRLCDRRLQLAGREFGNGFEIWRSLRAKFEGSGAILDVAGTDCFHALEEMLDKYGGQLIDYAPAHVRVMLIKMLPTEIETELIDNPQLDSWEKILAWCRSRLRYKNQKFLASYLRPGSSRMSALRHDESSDSDDDDEPSKRATRGRDTTGRPDPRDMETMIAAMVRKQMKGNRTTSPARDQKKRFIWDKGCHECGGDHMRSECGTWRKLMSENNGRMPAGLINAYSKARDAFNKANGIVLQPKPPFAKKTHAKALLEADIDS